MVTINQQLIVNNTIYLNNLVSQSLRYQSNESVQLWHLKFFREGQKPVAANEVIRKQEQQRGSAHFCIWVNRTHERPKIALACIVKTESGSTTLAYLGLFSHFAYFHKARWFALFNTTINETAIVILLFTFFEKYILSIQRMNDIAACCCTTVEHQILYV